MKNIINLPALLVCAVGVSMLASPGLCLGQDAGLIGHWTFDDPANLGKDSASTNNGVVAGGAYSFVSARVGAGALAVNGTDGHIAVADAPGLRFTATQSYTVSAWIQTPFIAGGWRGLVTKSRDQAPFYGLWLDNSGQAVGGQNNLAGQAVTEGWHLLSVVQDGEAGTRDLYVDGAAAASGSPIDANGAGPLFIGGASGVSEFFNGLIDDARIYNRALSADEIAELFNAPEPVSKLPLALLTQPLDFKGSPGDKARFVARANAMNLTCQWYKGAAPAGEASTASFNNGGAEAVFTTDTLTAADEGATYWAVFSGDSGSVTSRVARVSVLAPVFSPGFLKRELYADIAGTTIADLTGDPNFPDSPDETGLVGLFEGPSNFRDFYGQRLSGLVTPSETGNYIFYLAADDNAELYLSTDDSPANKQLIAVEPDWNPVRYWTGTDRRNPDAPENISAPVALTAGKRYYVEVLQKEGSGGDNLAVTAVKQGDPAPANGSAPLGGAFVGVMATPAGQTISITNQPSDVVTNELATVVFSAGAAASGNAPLAYQWQKNGANIFKAVEASYTTPPIGAADNNSTYSCTVYLPGNVSLKTREAVLKVDLDKTAPAVTGIFCPAIQGGNTGNQIYVAFDETLDPASAANTANYTLSPIKRVTAASLLTDGKTVLLTTDDLTVSVNYQITIKNVTDRSSARNRMTDTVKPFQASNLIAHYTFDDPSGLGADSAGINSAKTFGAASFTDSSRVGGGALQVDGASGHLVAPNQSYIQFAGADSYTVAVWFQAQPNGSWGGIVTKSRSNGSWYGIWRNPDLPRIFTGSAEVWPPTEPLLPDGDWHHAAIVQDGASGTYKLYVDGVDQNITVQPTLPDTGPGDLWIGAADNGEYYKGLIDDVRIYNRALSESEVLALATAAQPDPKVSLAIARAGGNIQITWPASATGFTLQSADQIASDSWQTVSQTPVAQGGQYRVEIAIGTQSRFYRLNK